MPGFQPGNEGSNPSGSAVNDFLLRPGGHHAGVNREVFVRAELTRAHDGGINRMQSWIPAKVAVVGKVIDLKDEETGEWTRGWRVESVTHPPMEMRRLRNASRDHLKMRKASDI